LRGGKGGDNAERDGGGDSDTKVGGGGGTGEGVCAQEKQRGKTRRSVDWTEFQFSQHIFESKDVLKPIVSGNRSPRRTKADLSRQGVT